jgi:threonine-phosphate decarboxylase
MNTHGGDRHAASLRTGIPERKLIDFSASINPLGIPARALAVIREHVGDLAHYPEPFAGTLAARLEEYHKLEPGSVICGNGSTELIYLVPAALKPGCVLIPAPTFAEYEKACGLISKTKIRHFPLSANRDFAIDPGAFIREMKRGDCDMAFLCNPNNPTGQLLGTAAVLRIAAAANKLKCRLVVDEAYMEFCAADSVMREVRTNPHLIVLRSMTKFYSLPGLRLGFGVFHRAIAEVIRRHLEPWTVNTLAQKVGIAAIADVSYRRSSLKTMLAEKKFMETGLAKTGIVFVPSSVNYYLARSDHAADIISALEQKGILVRDCSNFRGLDRTYLRIAVRARTENRILIKELAALCGAH